MRKKKQAVELLPPEPNAALERLAELVSKKLKAREDAPEALSDAALSERVLLEPMLLPREISYAILRLLPVRHREKFGFMYDDWGCFRCGTKERIHYSHGLCGNCYQTYRQRLSQALSRRALEERPSVAEMTAQLTRQSDSARALLGTSRKTK